MPETIDLSPSENERLKDGMEEVQDLLERNGKVNSNDLTIESQEALNSAGVSIEVVNVMAFKHTANTLILTTLTGLPNNIVNSTIQALRDQGLIEQDKMGESAKLKLPLNQEAEKINLVIQTRAKRAKNNQHIKKLATETPDNPEEVLNLYSAYERLKNRKISENNDISKLKDTYHAYSTLLTQIKTEIEAAITMAGTDQTRIDQLESHLKAISEEVEAIQLSISEPIAAILKKEEDKKLTHYTSEYKGVEEEELEEEIHELHAQLDHLYSTQPPIDLVFTPYLEYYIRKIYELELRIQVVEMYINNPNAEIVNQEPPEESQTTEPNEAEPETDQSNDGPTEPPLPPHIGRMMQIHNPPDEEPTDNEPMSIEDIEREALAQPEKPPERQPTPEEQAEKAEREKEDTARMSRRRFLGLAAIGTAAAIGTGGMIVHKVLNPDVGVSTPDIDLPNFGGSSTETSTSRFRAMSPHELKFGKFSDPEKEARYQAALKREIRRKKSELDDKTQNWLAAGTYRKRIDEHIVEHSINGHKLMLRESVMKRFATAWELLGKAGIPFTGFGKSEVSHFRQNQTQFIIGERNEKRDTKVWVGSMTGSYHLSGQAIDVQQMGNGRGATAKKIKRVLKAFGFHWGVQGSKKSLVKKGFSSWKDIYSAGKAVAKGKGIKEAYKDLTEALKTEDRVHFRMSKGDLAKAPSIEAATTKAKKVLGL